MEFFEREIQVVKVIKHQNWFELSWNTWKSCKKSTRCPSNLETPICPPQSSDVLQSFVTINLCPLKPIFYRKVKHCQHLLCKKCALFIAISSVDVRFLSSRVHLFFSQLFYQTHKKNWNEEDELMEVITNGRANN